MSTSTSTRVVLGVLCLLALSLSAAANGFVIFPTNTPLVYGLSDGPAKGIADLPVRPVATTPKRKPVKRGVIREITRLNSRPIRPILPSFGTKTVQDPIRFTVTANKDSLAIGEEVELTIQADLMPIPPSLLFFFEDQKSFSLKVLIPDGFVQTGGSYYDYIGERLDQTHSSVTYTLRGRLTKPVPSALFTLLRGPKDGGPQSLFERKIDLVLPVRAQEATAKSSAKARIGSISCDVATTLKTISYFQETGVNKIRVYLNTGVGPSVEYSLNNSTYQTSPILTPTAMQGTVYLRYVANPTCVAAFPYNVRLTGQKLNVPSEENPCVPNSTTFSVSGPSNVLCSSTSFDDDGTIVWSAPNWQTVTLTATGCTGTVSWYSGYSTAIGTTGTTLTVSTAGVYRAECYCNSCDCQTLSKTWNVRQASLTPPTVNNAFNGCAGTTLNITAQSCPDNQYQWYTATDSPLANGTGPTYSFANPTTPGSTTLKVSCKNTCTESTRIPVVITTTGTSSNPTASDVTICSGATSVTLTASGCPSDYRWYSSSNATTPVGSGAVVVVAPNSGGTGTGFIFTGTGFTFTPTNAPSYWVACESGGCQSPRKEVKINALPALGSVTPAITLTNNSGALCRGGAVTFTVNNAPAGSTFRWPFALPVANRVGWVTKNNTALSELSSQASVTLNDPAPGNYTVEVIHGGYCDVLALSTPVAYKTALLGLTLNNNSSNLCVGQSATLTVSANEAATFTWYNISDGPSTAIIGTGASLTGNNGRYQVVGVPTNSGSSYCPNSETTLVSITSNPPAMTLTVGNASLLAGGSTSLTTTECKSGEQTGTIYWILNGTQQAETGTPLSITPGLGSWTYGAICKIGSCSTASDNTITVTVSNTCPSAIAISGGGDRCAGATTRLTVAGCNNGSILWSTGANGLETSIDVTPTTTTVYSATCTINDTGCSTVLIGTTTVNPINFALSPASPVNLCQGQPLTLNATGCPAGASIDWYEVQAQASKRTSIRNGNKSNSTTYVVYPAVGQTTYEAVCRMTGLNCARQVTVNTTAIQLVMTAGNNASCGGGAVAAALSVTATGIIGNSIPNLTFSWQGPSGAVGNPASVVGNGTYTVQTTYNGCSYTAATTISYQAPTTPGLSAPAGTICPGQQVALTLTGGCDGTTEWFTSAGASVPGSGLVVTVTPSVTTGYYVRCRRNTNCLSGNSNTVTIPVGIFAATASTMTLCSGGMVSLSATCCSGPITWRDVTNSVTYAGDIAELRIPSLAGTTQFQAQCGVGGVVNGGGTANVTVTVLGPLAYTATVSCGGNPVKGQINTALSGTAGLTVQYLLKRWDGTAFVTQGNWFTGTAGLGNLTDGNYELSVLGISTANPSVSVCQPPSTTLTVLCNCSVSAVASTTALNAGDEVTLWVKGLPFDSGNALKMVSENGTFRYQSPEGSLQPAGLAGNFTWEAWVKPTGPLLGGPDGSAERFVLYPHFNGAYFGAANDRNAGLGIAVGTNGIRLAGHTTGYYKFIAPIYGTAINGWAHLAVVVNNTELKVYLNGNPVQTVVLSTVTNGSTPLTLYPSNMITGNPDDPGKGRYLGYVDEVRLWSTARSATDIQANYKRILDRSEDGLRSYWRFESTSADGQVRSSAELSEVATLGNSSQIFIEPNSGYKDVADGPSSTLVWTRQPALPQSVTANSWTDRPPTSTTYVYTVSRVAAGMGTACVASVTVAVSQDKTTCICDACADTEQTQTDNPNLTPQPSRAENYVQETTYLTEDAGRAVHTLSYVDGLGRPSQQVQIGTGGYGYKEPTNAPSDLITHSEYDQFGRPARQFLPIALGSNGGAFRPGMQAAQINATLTGISYSTGAPGKTNNAYTESFFENSPLNRVTAQLMPGNTAARLISYRFNTANEVRMLTFPPTLTVNTPVSVGYFGAGQLSVSETTEENSTTTADFKDKEGRLMARRVSGLSGSPLWTLYSYDAAGQLRVVVPPLAVSSLNALTSFDPANQLTLKDLIFCYGYDNRGRMITKKVPGAAAVTMAYDSRDRLTQTTDGLNRTVVTTYDNLDRVLSTSLLGGQILTEQVYAPQTTGGMLAYDAVRGYNQTTKQTNLNGMLVASKTWVLGGAALVTSYHYDGLGRSIQTLTNNHLGSVDIASSRLDFVGRVLESGQMTHNQTLMETRTSYDRGGRVKMVCQQVSDAQTGATGKYWEPVARHSYNALGELTQKTLGCELQNLNYSYQMRGWLTGINNPDNLVGNTGQLADNAFYGQRLTYQEVGNITNWTYRTAQKQGIYSAPFSLTQNAPLAYSFTYDPFSRLTQANLNRSATSVLTQGTTYDANGNIQTLNRYLQGAMIDNLTYSYTANTNQLAKVEDSGTTGLFNNGGSGAGVDYAYDGVGNLKQDANKGITGITYNLLNLPQQVTLTNAGSTSLTSYTYTAGGQKLRASFPGGKVYDYVGGAVFEGGKLEFVPTAEGRVLPPGRAVNPALTVAESYSNVYPRHEYHLKDHLGDLRVACRCMEVANPISPANAVGPVVVQEEHYDPWGLSLAGLSSLTVATPSRFKYNTKEEQQGLGWMDYGARIYSPDAPRWLQIDPLSEKWAHVSPYIFSLNNTIKYIDPDGRDVELVVRGKGSKPDRSLVYESGNVHWKDTNKKYEGRGANNTIWRTIKAFQKIENSGNKILKGQLEALIKSDKVHTIEAGKDVGKKNGVAFVLSNPSESRLNGDRLGTRTHFDFSNESKANFQRISGVPASDFTTVTHEMRHIYDYDKGNMKDVTNSSASDPAEIRAVHNENIARKIEGLEKRTTYGGVQIDPALLKNPPNN